MPRKTKVDEKKRHWKVVLFYPRTHAPTFRSKLEAERYLKARALTKGCAAYAELWEMDDGENGEQLALFDYGSTEPQELVRK